MTFSIVARDGEAYGIAVASKFLAVGAVVPQAELGVGAVATQSMARVAYRRELLDALREGHGAVEALAAATAADDLRESRQIGVVGARGAATFTGTDCMDWAGGVSGSDATSAYAIQGNILTGPEVVAAMEKAWLASTGKPLQHRLMTALLAGDAAGGDARGRQSAAIYAVAPEAGYDQMGVLADLRVDEHPQAPIELARLVDLADLYFGGPEDVQPLTGQLANEVRHLLSAQGHGDPDLATALADWAGEVNLETRLSPHGIDARVLRQLRATSVKSL